MNRDTLYNNKNLKENSILLENYSYDDAIVGITESGSVVYDFDLMIAWLCETEDFNYEDAVEWIEYNTFRAIPYFQNKGIVPTIVYKGEDDKYYNMFSDEHVLAEK